MKAYSPDLRAKIMDAVDAGMTKSDAARTFRVGLATVKRYAARRRDTGSLAPTPIPGRPRTIGLKHRSALIAQLQALPDVRLEDHCALLAVEHELLVSVATMSRAIRRLGWTRKKKRWVPPNGTSAGEPCGIASSETLPAAASSSLMKAEPISV